ncbi:MAG: ribonuclease III [Planctomycetota bacterium]
MDDDRRRELERRLAFRFQDVSHLEDALTHSSVKTDQRPSNERLEFLGDAVIGLVVSDFLYDSFPEKDEGELTRIKSVVVSADSLSAEGQRLGLADAVAVGRGMKKDGLPSSILANVFEAITGAIYLDGGIEHARRFVLLNLAPSIERVLGARTGRNWKSLLQQYTQRLWAVTPTYEVARTAGPDHVKEFEVVALVKGDVRGAGRGRSKKHAEQDAARAALESYLGDGDAVRLAALAEQAVLGPPSSAPASPESAG